MTSLLRNNLVEQKKSFAVRNAYEVRFEQSKECNWTFRELFYNRTHGTADNLLIANTRCFLSIPN